MRRRLPARRACRPAVSASALAEMGVCERRVVFDHRYGRCRSRTQRQAMERGGRLHRDFYRAGLLQPMAAVLGVGPDAKFAHWIRRWLGRLAVWLLRWRRGKGGGGPHGA